MTVTDQIKILNRKIKKVLKPSTVDQAKFEYWVRYLIKA